MITKNEEKNFNLVKMNLEKESKNIKILKSKNKKIVRKLSKDEIKLKKDEIKKKKNISKKVPDTKNEKKIDPVSSISISKGLLDGLSRYNELSKAAMKRVKEFYTWERTAARYLSVIKDSLDAKDLHSNAEMPVIDDTIRITEYLTDKV